jgi:hypothetical protein
MNFLLLCMSDAFPDDNAIWQAIDTASLAHTTKGNHKRRLRFLTQHVYNRRTKLQLLHLVSHPAYAIKAIEAHTNEAQTRKTYASSILAYFKHLLQLKDAYPKESQRWLAFERAEGAKITEQYRSNIYNEVSKTLMWKQIMVFTVVRKGIGRLHPETQLFWRLFKGSPVVPIAMI